MIQKYLIYLSILHLGIITYVIMYLNVYDMKGELVITPINEQLNISYHSIHWDGTNQSSGMYLVRMESGDYVETRILLLVK